MPFKTFTPSVLTAADMNDYLMKQAVITCTSGTRPSSPVEGMTIYETDTDCYATYTGSAWERLGGWQAWTPTVAGITLGNGTVEARYTRIGKTVSGKIRFLAGSTTSYSGSGLSWTLPFNAVTASSTDVIGQGFLDNGSAATRRLICITTPSTGACQPQYDGGGPVTGSTPVSLGTGGRVSFSFTYEAV